jgi:TolB-like protein/Flp pilus assembly protein TadD
MPHEEFDSEVMRRALQRVLESPGFARNERLSQFLRFVVEKSLEGRGNELKESVIAVEVFGRRADYDPKLDSIVRTEAGRLRARLAKYYGGEGSGDAIVIDLPKGGYTPVFRSNEATPSSLQKSWWRRFATVRNSAFGLVAVVLVALVGVGGWWWGQRTPMPLVVAVLPLESLGGDPANDEFADGLTDEIISTLSVIEGLAVRSRTSSFAFKGKPHNVTEAGQQLKADFILEGSILRSSERLRVNIQLVRVRDDFVLWSNQLDRELTDIFAIQDEISLGVVNNLRLKLGRGKRRYETNSEVYDLYLRARVAQGRDKAIEIFEQVVAKDPSFAPAWAGLAGAYAVRSIQFPLDHPADELTKMRTAAERAIHLDPLLAEAHDALAMAYARNGEWKQAEASFGRALELEPNRSQTVENFALWYLRVLGRNEEALQQLRAAERADPLSSGIRSNVAEILLALGRYDEAAAICATVTVYPSLTKRCLARAHLANGRTDEAIRILSDSDNPLDRGFLGYGHAQAGHREKAEKQAAASNYPNEQALIFAGLSDKDRTFEALERMASLGPQRVGVFLNYPEMAFLRDDPRLKSFRKKVGLPE